MKSSKLFLITVIMLLFISSARSQWTPCQGIEGANCNSIIYQDSSLFVVTTGGVFKKQIDDPTWDSACFIYNFNKIRSTGSALFCCGGNLMLSLFRSLDNGTTWESLDYYYEYRNIENADSIIFLDTYYNGLLSSSDDGETWTEIMVSASSSVINSIYTQEGILFCFLEDIDSLYRSNDYGITWTPIPLTGVDGFGHPYLFSEDIWLSRENHFYVFNATGNYWTLLSDSLSFTPTVLNFIEDAGTLCCLTNNGYYGFDDQDSTWQDRSDGLESRKIWDACKFDNTIYVATSAGPFSKTGDEAWTPQYNDLFGMNVSNVFEVGNRIYASALGKIFFSDDVGLGFEPMVSEGYCPGNMINTDSAWYLGSDCGFAISSDSGQTWIYRNNGLEGHGVKSISVSDQYYFAEITIPYGLARTRIDSISWERVPNEFGQMYITDLEVINTTLFAVVASSDYTLFKSDDYGLTFEEIPETGNYIRKLYVKNDKIFVLGEYNDVFYSDDSGETWNTWIYNPENLDFISIDITDDENTTILGGSIGPWNPINKIALYSPDFPQGQDITDNLPPYMWTHISEILIYNGGIFACPYSGGLWYRDDLAVGFKDDKPSNTADDSQLSIYPNPAKDIIRINYDEDFENAEYQVIDYSGILLTKGKIDSGTDNFSLDVSSLPGGIYLMTVRNNDCLLSGKFIKAN